MEIRVMSRWALGLMLALLLGACGKKGENPEPPIVDFTPINLVIEVLDADGNDLVNPNHPNTIVKSSVRAEIEGKFFELRSWVDARESRKPTKDVLRYYLPMWYGLSYAEQRAEGRPWVLVIGEFDGSESITREVKLHWEDGTTSLLKYSNSVRLNAKGFHSIERHYYLDGVEVQPDKKTGVIYRFAMGAPLGGTQ